MRKYTSEEEVAFGQTLETSACRSPAEGRALPLHTAAARAAFARRVAAVCPDAASWRADPQALWTTFVSQFGVRHQTRKVQRIQRFILGFSPVLGENIVSYLSRFEAELAAIEDESPHVLGGELALPVYLKTSLEHVPQCRLVFAKRATKSHADYEKYKRYLIQSFEDIHSRLNRLTRPKCLLLIHIRWLRTRVGCSRLTILVHRMMTHVGMGLNKIQVSSILWHLFLV
jgi:hypothetical protein